MDGDRDAYLRLPLEDLLRQCKEERYRAGGPGGQRRNKVETAVRLTHVPTGVTAHAEESRSRQENRMHALRRLRVRLAVEIRAPFDLDSPPDVPELEAQRSKDGVGVNSKNPAYVIILATALDALDAASGSYAPAAKALGMTTSSFVRFLRSDTEAWRWLSEARAAETRP